MTYAGAPQYFSIAWTTSSRVAVLLFKPKTAKSEILCQLSERGPMLMLFTRQSASSIEQIENQPPASGIFPCPAAGFGLFCFILPG